MLAAWSACLGALSGPRHSGVVTFPRVVRPRPRPRPRLCRVLRGVLRHSKQAQACDAQEGGCNTLGDLVTQALNTFLNTGGREDVLLGRGTQLQQKADEALLHCAPLPHATGLILVPTCKGREVGCFPVVAPACPLTAAVHRAPQIFINPAHAASSVLPHWATLRASSGVLLQPDLIHSFVTSSVQNGAEARDEEMEHAETAPKEEHDTSALAVPKHQTVPPILSCFSCLAFSLGSDQ
ncbi:hypothetical protein K456DRAFT_32667 [Colletotrichum gloeosporioides 23]|nr:hypothetical protein K456DRAFT_32667 [Colletotrichum gloeosporioides 23]